MKKLIVLLLCLSAMFAQVRAEMGAARKSKKKVKSEVQADTVKKETPYDKFMKEKPETHKGLITLHKSKGKLYFELPLTLLGRDMLLGSTVSEISDNGDAVIGSKPFDPLHFTFSKVGNKINLVKVTKDYITNSENPELLAAIDKNSAGAVMQSFKIDSYSPDSTAVVFDVTSFFVGDKKAIGPFSPYAENVMGGLIRRSSSYQSDKSFLGEIKAFASNVSVQSHLSYTYSLNYKTMELAKDVPFTAVMTRSIILLDEKPYRPRRVDSRIGIFPTGKLLFDEKDQASKIVYYANRWRLEPSDEAAFRRGEKVEPERPIVFYIDPAFPAEWKKPIFEAVNQWQEPFEAVGFKNAIVAKEYPSDDPEFDPDNIKYSCIRYAPIGVQNAMGPSWVDPRSGEIINASVYVYHDVVKLLNNWRFIQTAQTDESVRGGKLPQQTLDDALRYVLSHEIGHCLGLMHNMSASAVIPVDSLRSPSYTQKYGTTTSIMDYARFNYVAQPGDMQRGVRMTPPRFGVYDYFAIKWAYTPVYGVETPEEEYAVTSKWLTEAAANPVYRYGKQQFRQTLDPRSQAEDLGDDAMKASAYGIKNLKYILANLNEWVDESDKDFKYRTDIYTGIIYQYITYIQHVFANVGGIYLQEKLEGDPVDAYRCVPRAVQKEAFDFLCREVRDLDWLDNKELMKNIPLMGSAKKAVQVALIQAIVMSPFKIAVPSMMGNDVYTPSMCMKDVYDRVWAPTIRGRKLSELDMMMQREYMKAICSGAGLPYSGGGAVPDKKRGLNIAGEVCAIEMPECIREYAAENRRLCYNGGCDHLQHSSAAANPVAGYESPDFFFITAPFHDAEFYTYLLKVQRLLKSRSASASGDVKAHYDLILRNIEKTLK